MPEPELLERLDGLPRLAFEGEAFRHVGPGYEPLDTDGARIRGGRWNPPESFPVLYLALGAGTAAAEFYRLAERQAMPPESLLPRRLWRYRVVLDQILDIGGALDRVGLSRGDLTADDMSRCRAVGEAAHYLGVEALRAPSATGVGEVLAVFFDRLRPGSLVEPLDFETWERLPHRPR